MVSATVMFTVQKCNKPKPPAVTTIGTISNTVHTTTVDTGHVVKPISGKVKTHQSSKDTASAHIVTDYLDLNIDVVSDSLGVSIITYDGTVVGDVINIIDSVKTNVEKTVEKEETPFYEKAFFVVGEVVVGIFIIWKIITIL